MLVRVSAGACEYWPAFFVGLVVESVIAGEWVLDVCWHAVGS
jgi:hypothetical protein